MLWVPPGPEKELCANCATKKDGGRKQCQGTASYSREQRQVAPPAFKNELERKNSEQPN
jgi:hypothetical protein